MSIEINYSKIELTNNREIYKDKYDILLKLNNEQIFNKKSDIIWADNKYIAFFFNEAKDFELKPYQTNKNSSYWNNLTFNFINKLNSFVLDNNDLIYEFFHYIDPYLVSLVIDYQEELLYLCFSNNYSCTLPLYKISDNKIQIDKHNDFYYPISQSVDLYTFISFFRQNNKWYIYKKHQNNIIKTIV